MDMACRAGQAAAAHGDQILKATVIADHLHQCLADFSVDLSFLAAPADDGDGGHGAGSSSFSLSVSGAVGTSMST
jgi:hypothetical protein